MEHIQVSSQEQTHIGLSTHFEYPNGIPRNMIHKELLKVSLEDFSGIEVDKFESLAMDFVIVFDRSSSTRLDKKLANILSTIHYTVKHLTEKHRICIISFNREAELFTCSDIFALEDSSHFDNGFVRLTAANKQRYLII